ncbi:hypothetical protein NM96_10625 [Neisseria mucosa]|nr:hypothetical protein NM96_10625 [Neisseria mucosa]
MGFGREIWQIKTIGLQFRHSRAGGNPGLGILGKFQGCRNFKFLDSRLRGNDGGRREFQATSPQK